MTAPRSIVLLLSSAVAVGGLAAQSPAAAPPEAAAEEVYVPERATAPGTVAPANPTPASGTAPAPSTMTPAASASGDKKLPATTAKGSVGAPPPLSPRFQQIRDRIDVLLKHRSETPPAFDPRKNPFRPAGAAPVEPTAVVRGGAPAAPPPPVTTGTDYQLLQAAAATLKVSGTVTIEGRAHLIINQVAYKEGDVLNARVKGQPVFVRVKHISRYSYTLSLNRAELSVKY